MLKFRAALLLAAIIALTGLPLRADLLLNSQLTATLSIPKATIYPNWFDPSVCLCGGYANATSATVTLNSGDNTLAANIPTLNLITVDWSVKPTGDSLTFNVLVDPGASGLAWTETFQDAALANFFWTQVSTPNPIPGLSISAPSAGTWVVSWAGTGVSNGLTTYSTSFTLTDPPSSPMAEARSRLPLMLELGGLALLVVLGRRMKPAVPSNG